MPVGGQLRLKGGAQLQGIQKKKNKKKKKAEEQPVLQYNNDEEDGQQQQEQPKEKKAQKGITVGGRTYEEEFQSEIERAKEGKARSTPWGVGYRAPPQILHGYDKVVKGDTVEERLDLRCASKSDKFCK